ncbi:MAG: polysaccharide pyruvyl transferase family protein [Actinobacteria bacterium]|nr:polysaccharide pyruvyl transferase family protein [Actinomycetota bacterium]
MNLALISFNYGFEVKNISDEGRRLLLIGSVAHRILAGDLVFGVGTKGIPIPGPSEAPCRIVGTRGPITTESFSRAGHDLSELEFEFDPGLLIAKLLGKPEVVTANRVIFIPHYRDRAIRASRRKSLQVVDVDSDPVNLARQIGQSELVYTSSLHGLIFAHALGRPAVLVRPSTDEPLIKYQDYFASIGEPWRAPFDLSGALRKRAPESPVTLPESVSSLRMPTVLELQSAGVV